MERQGLLAPERTGQAEAALFLSPTRSLGNAWVGESEGRQEAQQAARCSDSFSRWGVITWLNPGLDSPFCWLCDLQKIANPL